MTVFPVGEDSLMLCSRCHAVVTQPWHDKLRETADALSEAQRENEELREDLVWAVQHDAGLEGSEDDPSVCYYGTHSVSSEKFARYDGADADLCRAIREARRGD